MLGFFNDSLVGDNSKVYEAMKLNRPMIKSMLVNVVSRYLVDVERNNFDNMGLLYYRLFELKKIGWGVMRRV
jgi:hypothetical protein